MVERKPEEKGNWKKEAASRKAGLLPLLGRGQVVAKGTSHTDLRPKEQIKTNWA